MVSISSCAVYPRARRSKDLEETNDELLAIKAGVYQILAEMQGDDDEGFPCEKPAAYQPRVKLEKKFPEKPEPKPEPTYIEPDEEEREDWVFRWEKVDSKTVKLIFNANKIRKPTADEKVYWVGDQQGWYSKRYPLQKEEGAYVVNIPVKDNIGRHRCNYVVLNRGPTHSVRDWAIFEPSHDPKWVKRGDLTPDGHYAYCIVFQINPDGTIFGFIFSARISRS